MTRRDFIATTGAGLLAALVPSWLIQRTRKIDLRPFCNQDFRRYNCASPFVQHVDGVPYAFGTDGRIAVRADADNASLLGESVKLPPAQKLNWSDGRGWQPWPRKDWLVATDSDCLTCGGYGIVGKRTECGKCQGVGAFGEGFMEVNCSACYGRGEIGAKCPACADSTPIGTRPGIQRVGGFYVAAKYDDKVRRHLGECDWRVVISDTYTPRGVVVPITLMQLRFDGGLALLCSLDRESSEKRIKEARS